MSDVPQFDGVILDVDGTLYRQAGVRRSMMLRLVFGGLGRVRTLQAFRRALEEIREGQLEGDDQPALQLARAAAQAGVTEEEVTRTVDDWMHRRPLPFVARHAMPGLQQFLAETRRRHIPLAAFSEYPCRNKLEALGISESIPIAASAYDKEIRRFKPDPTGFLVVARQIDVAPEQTLVIGDRDDADGEGARRAGMKFLQIGSPQFPSFVPLCKHLFD